MKKFTFVLICSIILSKTILAVAAASPDISLKHIKPTFSMNYTGRVTPLPKEVLSKWELIPLTKVGLNVKIATSAHNAIKLARNLLIQRAKKYSKKAEKFSDKKVTVYLGEINSVFIRDIAEKLKINLDGLTLQPQGYIIRKKGNSILVAGEKHRGTFYGAMTIYQSIGAPDGKLVLRCAELNDWPTWQYRSYATYPVPGPNGLLSLAMYKISGLTIQTRKDWQGLTPERKIFGKYKSLDEALKALKKFDDTYDLLDYMFRIHIYAHAEMPLDVTNKQDIDQLAGICSYLTETGGIGHIIISAEDWTPEEKGRYVCYYPSERKKFNDSVGRAHGYLMRSVDDKLKTKFPDLRLTFTPAPYSIYQHGVESNLSHQKYLHDLSEEVPDNVYIQWSGPRIRSWNIKKEDFIKWQGFINNHKTHLWDNTCCPPEIRRCSTKFYDEMARDNDGIIFLNGDLFGKKHYLPFVINSNDYLWNPENYQEKVSYQDVVEKLYCIGTYRKAAKFIEKSTKLLDETLTQKKVLALLDELDALSAEMKKDGWKLRLVNKKLQARRKAAEITVPHIKVSRFAATPILDGKLDDACWDKSSSFQLVPVSGKNEKIESTICYIGYDDNNLYLGVEAKRSVALKNFKTLAHDRKVWLSEDCIELFIQGEKKSYAQLIFDHVGNQADIEFGLGIGGAWNPTWKLATDSNDKDWSAEVVIPFSSMLPIIEDKVKIGTVWRFNIIRKTPKLAAPSAWSPTKGNRAHTRSLFGKLIFEK